MYGQICGVILKRHIISKLSRFRSKFIILSGPRQSGKTFVIKNVLKPDLVLDMDIAEDRFRFKKFPNFLIDWYETKIGPFPPGTSVSNKPLVFIDEIHKVRGWRDLMKGTFDKTSHAIDFVASGSSAFKLRRQDKGDSLAGRAFWFELSPVTFREYVETVRPDIELPPAWQMGNSLIASVRGVLNHAKELRLLWNEYFAYGAFPENLIRRDGDFYRQWLKDYVSAMLDRDLKDLGTAKDTERVYQTFCLLLEGLGSTYSLRSIAKTLSVAPDTIKSDVGALKQVLWGWELPVATVSKVKQIRKEKKFYPSDFCFADYISPKSPGARFECAIACALRRSLMAGSDQLPAGVTLGFCRDYSKREIDLVVAKGRKFHLFVECKTKADDAGNLKYFTDQFKPAESVLAVGSEGIFEKAGNYFVVSAELVASVM